MCIGPTMTCYGRVEPNGGRYLMGDMAGGLFMVLLDGEDAEAAAYAMQRLGGRAYREHQDRIQELLRVQSSGGLSWEQDMLSLGMVTEDFGWDE